jgi:hypothetical protein
MGIPVLDIEDLINSIDIPEWKKQAVAAVFTAEITAYKSEFYASQNNFHAFEWAKEFAAYSAQVYNQILANTNLPQVEKKSNLVFSLLNKVLRKPPEMEDHPLKTYFIKRRDEMSSQETRCFANALALAPKDSPQENGQSP